MPDQLQQYYDYLKSAGADVPSSFDSFRKTLSDEASAKQYYQYLRDNEFDAPDSYDSFANTLGLKKKDTGGPLPSQFADPTALPSNSRGTNLPGIPTSFKGGKNPTPEFKLPKPQQQVVSESTNVNKIAPVSAPTKTVDEIYEERANKAINNISKTLSESDDIIKDIVFDKKIKKQNESFGNMIRDNANVSFKDKMATLYDIHAKNKDAFVTPAEVAQEKQKLAEDARLRNEIISRAIKANPEKAKELKKDYYIFNADQRVQEGVSDKAQVVTNSDAIDKDEYDYKVKSDLLIDPTGFIGSFMNGLKQRSDDLRIYDYATSNNKEDVINLLEEEMKRYDPDAAVPSPDGLSGELGGMLGSEAIPIGKGILGTAAGSALASTGVGAPIAGAIGGALLSSPEQYKRAYGSSLRQAYFELRGKGLTKEQAFESAKNQAQFEGGAAVVENIASMIPAAKIANRIPKGIQKIGSYNFTRNVKQIADDVFDKIGEFAKDTGLDLIRDVAVASASQVAKNIKAEDNNLKRSILDDVYENAKGEAMFTLFMGIGGGTINSLVDPKTYRAVMHSLSLNDKATIESKAQEMVASGELTESQAKRVIEDVDKYKKITEQIPEDIDEESKMEIVPKILEREEMQAEYDRANKAFKPAIKEKIDAIDTEIQKATGYIPESKKEEVGPVEVKKPVEDIEVIEEVKPEVKKPNEQEYTTPSGKFTVKYNNGRRVVVDKSGNKVDNKAALNQHAENYDYTFGQRADENLVPPQFRDEVEADTWIAENSNNPIEIAEVYERNQPQSTRGDKDEIIYNFYGGAFKTTEDSYNRFGDRNNMNNAKARAYIKKGSLSLDQIAMQITDHSGVEVTPQDLVDYMDKYPNGTDAAKMVDNEARAMAKERFEKITGIPLTDKTAKFALAQKANEIEISEVEQGIDSLTDEDFARYYAITEDGTENTTADTTDSGTGAEVQPIESGTANEQTQGNQNSDVSGESVESEEEQLRRIAAELGVDLDAEDALFNLSSSDPSESVTANDIGIQDGDSIDTVLDKMIEFGGPYSDILKFIKSLDKKPEFQFYSPGKNQFADNWLVSYFLATGQKPMWEGLYIPKSQGGKRVLLLNPEASGNAYYTITHELMHFLTLDSIKSGQFEGLVGSSKMNQLKKIYNFIESKKGKRGFTDPVTNENYGLTNFNEFMAEVLINEDFRNYLSDVFAENQAELDGKMTFKDFIAKFVDAIKEFFSKLMGRQVDKGAIDFDKPLVESAVNLMQEMFFDSNAGVERIGEGAFAVMPLLKANPVVKLVKKAMMEGKSTEEIRAAIKRSSPELSDDIVTNIIKNAERMNIYRPLSRPEGEGVVPTIPEDRIPEIAEKKVGIIKVINDAWKRFTSTTNGLPKEVKPMTEEREGLIATKYRQIRKTISRFNELSKKYKFTEADMEQFDKALRDLKEPKPNTSSETGIVPFDAGVAARGKVLSNAPALIPESMKGFPPEVQELIIDMRSQIDGMTKDAITNGFVDPELAIKMEGNMGEYLNRAYKLYSQKDWAKKIDPKVKRQAQVFLTNQAFGEILATDPTIPPADAEKQSIEIGEKRLKEILAKADDAAGIKTSGNNRNVDILKRREDIPEPIRKLMGEYTNPVLSYALSMAKLATFNAHSNFLAKFREFGMGSLLFEENDPNRPADHTEKVGGDSSKTWSPLNGLYTTKEIDEALKFNPDRHSKLIEKYLKFIGWVRWGKTVASPITQIKNFESNLGFAVMNGHYDVTNFKESMQYFANSKKVDGLVDDLIKLGVLGQSVQISELKSMLKDDNIHRLIRSVDGKKGVTDYLASIYDKLNQIYGASDNFWKIYGFLNEAQSSADILFQKKYADLTPEEKVVVDNDAAEIIKNIYPTYGRAWDGAKALSKYAPVFGNFISFTIESVRVLLNVVDLTIKDLRSSNPRQKQRGVRRLAGVLAYNSIRGVAINAIAQMTGIGMSGLAAMFNTDDEDEKLDATNRFQIPFMLGGHSWWNEVSPGVYKVYDVTSVEPYNVFYKAFSAYTNGSQLYGEPGALAATLEILGPFIEPEMTFDVAVQLYKNADENDKPIYFKEDSGGQLFTSVAGHIFKKLSPSVVGLTQRLIEREDKKSELWGFTGIRGYDIDIHKRMASKIRLGRDRIEAINNDFYGKQKNMNPYQAAQIANDRLRKIVTEWHKDYKAAVLLGGDPGELKHIIKGKSSSREYNNDIKKAILTGNLKYVDKFFKPSKAALKKWKEKN